jgi:hypothetical protein
MIRKKYIYTAAIGVFSLAIVALLIFVFPAAAVDLPQTGQITSYAAGDDGINDKGEITITAADGTTNKVTELNITSCKGAK